MALGNQMGVAYMKKGRIKDAPVDASKGFENIHAEEAQATIESMWE